MTDSSAESIRPVQDFILVHPRTTERERTGTRDDGSRWTIWVASEAVHEEPYGRVLAVGPDCHDCAVGDLVLYDTRNCVRVDANDTAIIGHGFTGNPSSGDGMLLVRERDVLAVLEPEPEPAHE